ncbi:hypothetical protein CSIM01_12609 [Colletotrichum simmondsii]|uniref:Uncharacterized protein n=1 Tax=Colletotrichum simmondsii TaxID=703756 RepID=A0A135RTJ7_9PEZI|nr:hypothetical protein CSIM01_12609 [Colletotrichum simmondsii]
MLPPVLLCLAHLQYPGRLGDRPDPPHLRHAENENAEPYGVVPGVWVLPCAVDATESEVVNEHYGPRSTVHVEECHGPVPFESDEGLQTLDEICGVTNVNETCHRCHHRRIRVARDICGPSGKGGEEELEIECYGVPLYCDVAEELA